MNAPSILLAAVLVLAAGWSLWRLPPLHPFQLWTTVWAVATCLYAVRLLPYRAPSWEAVVVAVGATLAFAGGIGMACRWRRVSQQAPQQLEVWYPTVQRAATFAVILAAAGLAAFLAQAFALYGVHTTIVSSGVVRYGIGHGVFAITVKYTYLAFAAAALCGIAAGLGSAKRARRFWGVMSAACVAATYFATGRATIVDAAVVAAVGYALARPQAPRRRRFLAAIIGVGALALVVFVIGGRLVGKTFANNPDLQSLPSVFSRHSTIAGLALPYEYASAPIAAMDVQVRVARTWGDGFGCAALPAACSGLRKIGVSAPAVERIRQFTAPPLSWNTYTALDVPLIDGGIALAVPLMAGLGFGIGLLWRLAVQRRLLGVLAYALEAVALVTAAGSFNFFAPVLVGGFACGAFALWLAAEHPRIRVLAQRVRGDAPGAAADGR